MDDSAMEDWAEGAFPFALPSYSQPYTSPNTSSWPAGSPLYEPYNDTTPFSYDYYFGTNPLSNPYFSDQPPSPRAQDNATLSSRYERTSIGDSPRPIHPRPEASPTSTLRPASEEDRSMRPAEKPSTVQRKRRASGKRKGREGPLAEEARILAARTRARGCCLYHAARKTSCGKEDPSLDPSGPCVHCVKTERPCYRLSPRNKDAVMQSAQFSNSATLDPLLAQAGSAVLEKRLRFRVELRLTTGIDTAFEIDQIPLGTGPFNGSGSLHSALGDISDRSFFERFHSKISEISAIPVAAHLSRWTDDRCTLCSEACSATELLNEAQRCLSIHLLLGCLVHADLRAPTIDQHAARCFVIAFANLGIKAFQSTLNSTLKTLFRVLHNHKKNQTNPGYKKIRAALVVLCAIVDATDGRQMKSKATDNTLVNAISNALPQAGVLAHELRNLSNGFCAIVDPVPNSKVFSRDVKTALDSSRYARMTIVLDGSGTESSLRQEGAQPAFKAANPAPWSAAPDVRSRTHGFPQQKVSRLFDCNRPSENDRQIFRSPHASPSVSDSERSGSWTILTDPLPRLPVEAGPSGDASRFNRIHKRARSDSMRIDTTRTEHKKAKSPQR